MLNDWFRTIELPMGQRQFASLPRHPAYTYEYRDGLAVLCPSPRYFRAMLDLTTLPPASADGSPWGIHERFEIRRIAAGDWPLLSGLMVSAFREVPPFSALDEVTAIAAAADCIRTTQRGGDGPLVPEACFVAVGREPWENPLGVVLITLVAISDITASPEGCREKPSSPSGAGQPSTRPHLTWIFVSPWHAGHGLGTELLRTAAAALRLQGHAKLASTFLSGNDRSAAWHWRNGFRLLQHAASPRAAR